MSVRHKSKRRCRNCPETDEGLPVEVIAPAIMTYAGEGEVLWRVIFVACSTLFELIFRYIITDVPGKPIKQLERLQTRLTELITLRKEREKINAGSYIKN